MRSFKYKKIFAILVSLICLGARGIEFDQGKNGILRAKLTAKDFLNEKIRKELSSGMSTKTVIVLRLTELPQKLLVEKVVLIQSKYDLWEEKFTVKENQSPPLILKSLAPLESLIEGPGPFELIQTSKMNPNGRFEIKAIESINPVSEERLQAVEKWLTEQRATLRGAFGSDDMTDPARPASTAISTLFQNLWKEAATTQLRGGELKRVESSGEFTLGEVKVK